jgi:prepilin-type N-terminal cleavage/methylation domain-containing protein
MRIHKVVSRAGFTLVEIMIVVAIIGLLASIAIPNYARARTVAQQKACFINVQQINGAKEQWALENRKSVGDPVVDAEINTLMKAAPKCPGGGNYTYGAVDVPATCSAPGH